MKGIILLTGLFTFNALASFPQAWINPSAKFNKNEVSSQEKEGSGGQNQAPLRLSDTNFTGLKTVK